jgi:hypothetical protein
VTESLRRKRNEKETKTRFLAVIGRGKKQLSCRPITAGYIIFVSFSFRFRFVFVSFSSQTFRHFVIPGRSRPRNGRKDPTLGNPNSPNSLFRSVGVLYVSVVSPEYSVFSGLTTETLLLEDRSVGRVDLFRIPPFRRLDFAGPSGGDHQIIAVRDVVTRLPTCPRFRGIVGKARPFAGNPQSAHPYRVWTCTSNG